MNFILQGIFVYIPVRYYMSLIPGVVVVGAATVGRWRHGPHALAAVAVVWSGALAFALIAAQWAGPVRRIVGRARGRRTVPIAAGPMLETGP